MAKTPAQVRSGSASTRCVPSTAVARQFLVDGGQEADAAFLELAAGLPHRQVDHAQRRAAIAADEAAACPGRRRHRAGAASASGAPAPGCRSGRSAPLPRPEAVGRGGSPGEAAADGMWSSRPWHSWQAQLMQCGGESASFSSVSRFRRRMTFSRIDRNARMNELDRHDVLLLDRTAARLPARPCSNSPPPPACPARPAGSGSRRWSGQRRDPRLHARSSTARRWAWRCACWPR